MTISAEKTTDSSFSGCLRFFHGEPMALRKEAMDSLIAGLRQKQDASIQAALLASLPEGPRELDVRNGIAIIPVKGPLAKGDSFAGFFFSRTGYGFLKGQVEAALSSPRVRAICLDIDSPGGTVAGTMEFVAFLRRAAEQKPLYAFADAQMTSAAYWVGSAARRIGATPTTQVGSIGVICVHVDCSAANERWGEKWTYITTGKWKAAGNPDEPLSTEVHKYFQERMNQVFDLFVGDVAENRRVPVDRAIEMADEARVYMAGPAKEAGLIDSVERDLDAFLETISQEVKMDLVQLKAEHPELVSQLRDQAKAEALAQAKDGQEAATKAASDGVLALVAAILGQAAADTLGQLLAAGVTPKQLELVKNIVGVGQAQQQAATPESEGGKGRQDILAALQGAHSKPLAAGPNGSPAPEKDFSALVDEYKAEKKCSRADAIKEMAAKHPEAYQAFLAQANPHLKK